MTAFPAKNALLCRFFEAFQRGHWWTHTGPTNHVMQLWRDGHALTDRDRTLLGVGFAIYNCLGNTTVSDVLEYLSEREVSIVTDAMVTAMRGDAACRAWWPSTIPAQARGRRIRALKVADPEKWQGEVRDALATGSEYLASRALGVSVKQLRVWKGELDDGDRLSNHRC